MKDRRKVQAIKWSHMDRRKHPRKKSKLQKLLSKLRKLLKKKHD